MSRQQLSLFCSAPRDRAVIQVFKTAAILFIDSVTVSMTSVTLLLTIVDIFQYQGSLFLILEIISKEKCTRCR